MAIWTDRGPTLVRWYRSAYFSISPLAQANTPTSPRGVRSGTDAVTG